MKTVHILRSAALIILVVTASALSLHAIEPGKISPPKDVRTVVSESIKYPNARIRQDYQGSVDILFKIENGRIVVKNANSSNSDLAKYVKEELSKINNRNIISPMNQYYSIRFTFRLI
jgi:hypothetical protein